MTIGMNERVKLIKVPTVFVVTNQIPTDKRSPETTLDDIKLFFVINNKIKEANKEMLETTIRVMPKTIEIAFIESIEDDEP